MVRAVDDPEGPVLDVCLDAGVRVLPPNQALCVEDCVLGVHGHLHTGAIPTVIRLAKVFSWLS